jgi:hypothetical protein
MTHLSPPHTSRNQGQFLGAVAARVLAEDAPGEGIVVLWERAIEVRGPVGRRVLPRAAVRSVRIQHAAQSDVLVIESRSGTLQLQGPQLAPWGHRARDWADGADRFGSRECLLGGGRAVRVEAGQRSHGALCCCTDRVVFVPDRDGEPLLAATWSEVRHSASGIRVGNSTFSGPGVGALLALNLAGKTAAGPAVPQISMTTPVGVGWLRSPHMLAIRPEGLALVPTSWWSALWSVPRSIPWSDIRHIHPAGPGGFRLGLPELELRLDGPWNAGLVAELRRHRLAVARARDLEAAALGRARAGWVVQVRASRHSPWTWTRLRRTGGRIQLDAMGSSEDGLSWTLSTASWQPVSDRPLTLAVQTPQGSFRIRPVGGHRFLPDWTRWMGAPVAAHAETAPHSRQGPRPQRRRDTRVALDLDAWVDPRGHLPDTSYERATTTVEVAMSSVVVVWPGPLKVGQEVGLALGLGGHPLATRARVARRVRDDLWAMVFVHPPAALVHRIGSRVRAREREDRSEQREETVPLTVGG